jgi:hypothetical protein
VVRSAVVQFGKDLSRRFEMTKELMQLRNGTPSTGNFALTFRTLIHGYFSALIKLLIKLWRILATMGMAQH